MTVLLLAVGAVTALIFREAASRTHHARIRGALLGCSAGMVFGLLAGVMKESVQTLVSTGLIGTVLSWPFWVMIVVGICGVSLNQRAYQAAPLAASMPVLNVVAVLVTIVFGLYVFGETPVHGWVELLAEVAGLIAVLIGLRQLLRPTSSPMVDPHVAGGTELSIDLA